MNDDRWTMRNPLVRLAVLLPALSGPLVLAASRAGWFTGADMRLGLGFVLLLIAGYAAVALKMTLAQHRKSMNGEFD